MKMHWPRLGCITACGLYLDQSQFLTRDNEKLTCKMCLRIHPVSKETPKPVLKPRYAEYNGSYLELSLFPVTDEGIQLLAQHYPQVIYMELEQDNVQE